MKTMKLKSQMIKYKKIKIFLRLKKVKKKLKKTMICNKFSISMTRKKIIISYSNKVNNKNKYKRKLKLIIKK